MKKGFFSKVTKLVNRMVDKHGAEILIGFGAAGIVATGILSGEARLKAEEILDNKRAEEQVDNISKVENLKATWKCYIKPVIAGAVTLLCFLGSYKVTKKKLVALGAAYSILDKAFSENMDVIEDVIGRENFEDIRGKINQKKVDEAVKTVPVDEIIETGDGSVLCLDALTGRLFRSSRNSIDKAVNRLNQSLFSDVYISLNELYDEIGLSRVGIGDQLGWNLGREGLIELTYTTQLADNDEPCLVVDFLVGPRAEYMSVF